MLIKDQKNRKLSIQILIGRINKIKNAGSVIKGPLSKANFQVNG